MSSKESAHIPSPQSQAKSTLSKDGINSTKRSKTFKSKDQPESNSPKSPNRYGRRMTAVQILVQGLDDFKRNDPETTTPPPQKEENRMQRLNFFSTIKPPPSQNLGNPELSDAPFTLRSSNFASNMGDIAQKDLKDIQPGCLSQKIDDDQSNKNSARTKYKQQFSLEPLLKPVIETLPVPQGNYQSPQLRARERIKRDSFLIQQKAAQFLLAESPLSATGNKAATAAIDLLTLQGMKSPSSVLKRTKDGPKSKIDELSIDNPGLNTSSISSITGNNSRRRSSAVQSPNTQQLQHQYMGPAPTPAQEQNIQQTSDQLLVAPENTVDRRAKNARIMKKIIKEQMNVKKPNKKFNKNNTLLQKRGLYREKSTKSENSDLKTQQSKKDTFTAPRQSYAARKSIGAGALGQGFGMTKQFYKEDLEDDFEKEDEDEEIAIFNLFQAANNQSPSKYVIPPDGLFKAFWDMLITLCVIWQAISVPFKLSFLPERSQNDELDMVTDVLFFLDILVTFNTGFFQNGVLIMNRRWIISEYLKFGFIIDALSTFPYTYIIIWMSDSETDVAISQSYRQVLNILRFMRFLKLLRILKIRRLKAKYEEIFFNDTVNMFGLFLKILIMVFYFAHTIACLFWMVGIYSSENLGVQQSWINKQPGLIDSDILMQYIDSLYWAFTTMVTVGYGDFSGMNTQERLFNMISMIFMAGVYAFALSEIGKTVQEYNRLYDTFRENMLFVRQWMAFHNLQTELRQNIIGFLEYQWEVKLRQKIETKELMLLLNQDLKEQIVMYTNGNQLKNLTFISEFKDMEFFSSLVFVMKAQNFGVGEDILIEREDGDKIFFIVSGRVCVLHRKTHTYLVDLKKDDYFGEFSFFSEKPRIASVKSRDFTCTITIDRQSYFNVGDEYDESLSIFYKIKNAIVEHKDYTYLKVKCYVCNDEGHISLQCPHFKNERGNLNKTYTKQLKSVWNWGQGSKAKIGIQEDSEENKYPLYGSDPESQIPNTELTSQSDIDSFPMRKLYAEHGYSYNVSQESTSQEQENSIVTETEQSLKSESSRMSSIKVKQSAKSQEEEFKQCNSITVPIIMIEDFDLQHQRTIQTPKVIEPQIQVPYKISKTQKDHALQVSVIKEVDEEHKVSKTISKQSSITSSLVSEVLTDNEGTNRKIDSQQKESSRSIKTPHQVQTSPFLDINYAVKALGMIPKSHNEKLVTLGYEHSNSSHHSFIKSGPPLVEMAVPHSIASSQLQVNNPQNQIIEIQDKLKKEAMTQPIAVNRNSLKDSQPSILSGGEILVEESLSTEEVKEEQKDSTLNLRVENTPENNAQSQRSVQQLEALEEEKKSFTNHSSNERMSMENQAHTHHNHQQESERDTAYDGTPFFGFVTCNNTPNNSQEGRNNESPRFQNQNIQPQTQTMQPHESSMIHDPQISANVFESAEVIVFNEVRRSVKKLSIVKKGGKVHRKRSARNLTLNNTYGNTLQNRLQQHAQPLASARALRHSAFSSSSNEDVSDYDNVDESSSSSTVSPINRNGEIGENDGYFHMEESVENMLIREFERQALIQAATGLNQSSTVNRHQRNQQFTDPHVQRHQNNHILDDEDDEEGMNFQVDNAGVVSIDGNTPDQSPVNIRSLRINDIGQNSRTTLRNLRQQSNDQQHANGNNPLSIDSFQSSSLRSCRDGQ